MKLDQQTLFSARRALQEAVRNWIYDPNVMLIDFGWPERGGKLVKDDLAIRVHVIEKFDSGLALEAAIAMGETRKQIPEQIGGFKVDVPQGKYRLHLFHRPWRRPLSSPRASRCDPMEGGISLSNTYQNIYGTLGGLVSDRNTGAPLILSNWHVLAGDWWAQPGRPICQPGRGDGGGQTDIVATLARDAMKSNLDAAVAKLNGSRQLINDQMDLKPVTGVEWAQIGMEVVKSGRRTGVTHGQVTAIEGTLKMPYSGVYRMIRNVMTIEPNPSHPPEVSNNGDSGSLWLRESTMSAVGLHFAGGNDPERALAMDIQPVLDALDVVISA